LRRVLKGQSKLLSVARSLLEELVLDRSSDAGAATGYIELESGGHTHTRAITHAWKISISARGYRSLHRSMADSISF
jgi:hypothetical protein